MRKTIKDGQIAAELYWRNAVAAILSANPKTARSDQSGSRLLETLFPKLFPDMRKLVNIEFQDNYIEQLAQYQAGQSNELLTCQLNIQKGLVDPSVVAIDIFHDNKHYTRGLLKAIATFALQHYRAEAESHFIELVATRFFGLTAMGITPVTVSQEALLGIFRCQMDEIHNERRHLSFPLHQSRQPVSYARNKPLVAVFGCLPLIDLYDLTATHCSNYLSSAGAHMETGRDVPGKILSGEERAFTPEEYWRHYKEFHANHPDVAQGADDLFVTPGVYRQFLMLRQAARDERVGMLGTYTGITRKKAVEQELLAEPYPLFFRVAEELVRQAGAGTVSILSRSEYLEVGDGKRMRKRFCSTFNHISITEIPYPILQMKTDVTAAVCTMARNRSASANEPALWYLDTRPLGGSAALALLMPTPPTLDTPFERKALLPSESNDYAFRPPAVSLEYMSWPSITGIYDTRFNGLMEKRGGALHDIDRERLAGRMKRYFDKNIAWNEFAAMGTGMTDTYHRFNPKKTRDALLRMEQYSEESVKPYLLRPFDVRWCYYSSMRPLWHEARAGLESLQRAGNHFLVVRSNQAVADEGVPFFFTDEIGDSDLLRGHAYFIPTWRIDERERRSANVSEPIQAYLKELGILSDITAEQAALMVHHHVLAIGFAPAYLHENRIELGQGWPRIPFPGFEALIPDTVSFANAAFHHSAELGRQVAILLQNETADADSFADIDENGLARLHAPGRGREFIVDREWGKPFRKGGVLPSHGKLSVRNYSSDEREVIETYAGKMGVHAGAAYSLLGDSTRDIYLNDQVCIQNIPVNVWEYAVGGYQALKKWLSYRETKILGRSLARRDVDGFCGMAKRMIRLSLLGFHLNQNYAVVRDSYQIHPPRVLVER